MQKKAGSLDYFMTFIVFLVIILSTFARVSAADIPSPTNKYINDFAGIFSDSEKADIQTMLGQLEQNTTAEVVVTSMTDCTGDYTGYAYNLASAWKIGKADKNNGFLILYCVTQKKLVAQTGYGLEGILPDSKIGRLMDDYYVPLRDNNKTTQGIIAFTNQIAQVINANAAEVISGQAAAGSNNIDIFTIIFWIFILYFIISKILGAIYKNKKRKDWPWFIPIFLPFPSRGSGSSGFSGGGFGGGGFGGGGFGGGGASR